mmetsp:Transcript_20385/g.20655  ORF Transcript_20385/g.20655 Transcript_20385/m.20655 type:complete len:123 (-) Transcript_20385:700-1068(-)
MRFSDATLRNTMKNFLIAGRTISKKKFGEGDTAERRFRSVFGVDILVCAIAWEWMNLTDSIPKDGKKTHFLWACIQLMVYPTENVLAVLIDVDEKTFRKWSWSMLLALSDLETDVVSLKIPL